MTDSQNIASVKDKRDLSPAFNRFMYGMFFVLAIYFAIRGDWKSAAANLGIGLIFDPFDQKMKWEDRPLYQKLVLFIQAGSSLTIFVLALLKII